MAKLGRRSTLGRFFYDLRYRIGEYSLRNFVSFLPYIPFRLVQLFTSFMAWVTFALLWEYRKRMEENIASTLGKEIPNADERKTLVWRAWRNFARGVLDTTAV